MDELYIDLNKAFSGLPHRLNTAKLVRRMVQVRGKNGKIFSRMQWVKPWEASTGHGVRAIHNDGDLKDAMEDGINRHPDFHDALKHQGVFNAEHMANSYSHEHPLFLPETADSRDMAHTLGIRNHIRHGDDEYNRHDHTNEIHFDDDDYIDDLLESSDGTDVKPIVPKNWADMTASQLAQHAVSLGMTDEEFTNHLRQTMDRDMGDVDAEMLGQVAEEMYYAEVGSRPSKPTPMKLPDLWHMMSSTELTTYAEQNYKGRYQEFYDALELAKRERSGGELNELDELSLDLVGDILGVGDSSFEDQLPLDFDDMPTISGGGFQHNDPISVERRTIANAQPEGLQAIVDGSKDKRATFRRMVEFHSHNEKYEKVLHQIGKDLGFSKKEVKDMLNDDLTESDRKIRGMSRGRVQSEAKPKSKAIGEQTQPLNINQIRKDYAGPSLSDFYEDKVGGLSAHGRSMIDDLFNGISVPALEHILSHPDGESYKAQVTSISVSGNRANMSLKFMDKDGWHIGHSDRYMERRSDGTYHVHNSLLSINDDAKDNGIATHLYHRSEQLWKHFAGEGNRVEVSVYANISIGKYAWADKDKGFDFASTHERNAKRTELKDFIELNGWNEDEVMKSCGYESVKDLNHAWQFASLHDGFTYDLTPHGFESLKGKASLGKAFMLTHGSSWSGMKYINDDGSVNRDKHIKRLVDDHRNSMGEWSFQDHELDNDEDETGEYSPANWFYSIPNEHRDGILQQLGVDKDDIHDYTIADWDNLRERARVLRSNSSSEPDYTNHTDRTWYDRLDNTRRQALAGSMGLSTDDFENWGHHAEESWGKLHQYYDENVGHKFGDDLESESSDDHTHVYYDESSDESGNDYVPDVPDFGGVTRQLDSSNSTPLDEDDRHKYNSWYMDLPDSHKREVVNALGFKDDRDMRDWSRSQWSDLHNHYKRHIKPYM